MLPNKMEVSDLLANESFVNYCKKSSPDDIAFWEDFASQHPAQRELVELAKERYFLLFNALAQADLDEQTTRLKNRLNLKEAAPVVKMEHLKASGSYKKRLFLLKLAGAAAVVFAGAFAAIRYFNTGSGNPAKIFTTAYGERKNIQLPDGSVVNLNAGSTVKIDADFGTTARNVYLEGEAFFDVKHDKKTPFIVRTAAMDIKALGTAFDVKAYKNESITEASLIRGLVEVTLKENDNQVLLLHPNHKIAWQQHRPPTAVSPVRQAPLPASDGIPQKLKPTHQGDIKEIAWKENRLVFDGEALSDIAAELERWYGARIYFKDDDIRNYRYTGVFEKEDLKTVLEFLQESRHFNFRIDTRETLTVSLSK